MVTGPHAKQSAMYLDAPRPGLPYTRYFRLVEHFVPEMRRLLVWGGGFSFPKFALANYANVSVDVVELDPASSLWRGLFRAQGPSAPTHHRGGRAHVSQPQSRDIRRHPLRYLQLALCHSFHLLRWKRRSDEGRPLAERGRSG